MQGGSNITIFLAYAIMQGDQNKCTRSMLFCEKSMPFKTLKQCENDSGE